MLTTQQRPVVWRRHRRACVARAEGGTPPAGAKDTNTKILVYSAAPYVHSFLQKPLSNNFSNVSWLEARLGSRTAQYAAGMDVVNVFVNDHVTEDVANTLAEGGVKLLTLRCTGFDRVDVAACNRVGITVARVPSYSPYAVAEHAVALIMTLNRKLHKIYHRVRDGNFTLNGLVGWDLHGKTVGVVATGRIGTIFASIMKGFGCRVLGFDKFPNADFAAVGEYVTLAELLAQSDVVSLHAPMNPSTYHLIGREQVAAMKKGAMLVNVSRGGLVDTDAVIHGLQTGRIGAYGADVYEQEGSLFFKDFSQLDDEVEAKGRANFWDTQMVQLTSLPNVILSPHSAFLTYEALDQISSTTVSNIQAWVRGEKLANEIVPAVNRPL